MNKASKRRLAENEVVFRQANTDVKDFLEDTGVAHVTTVPFFCECSDENCRGRIELSAEEFQAVHANRRQFIVLPRHEMPEIERVVDRRAGFNVVEKTADQPSDEDIDAALRRLTM